MFFTKFIILTVSIYLILLIFLYFYQGKLLYHPNVNSYTEVDNLIPKIEKVSISTSDNLNLLGWFHKKDISKKTILFFHGNAGSLENRIYKLNHFENFDLNFLIIAWRGFSGNSGKPNEKGLYDDGKSAVNSANSPKFYYFTEYDDHMMDYNKLLLEKLKSFVESLN